MEEIRLKPCPFCGGEASYVFDPEGIKDTEGRMWAYQITCNKCCATAGLCFSQQMAAEAWNRRAGQEGEQNEKS